MRNSTTGRINETNSDLIKHESNILNSNMNFHLEKKYFPELKKKEEFKLTGKESILYYDKFIKNYNFSDYKKNLENIMKQDLSKEKKVTCLNTIRRRKPVLNSSIINVEKHSQEPFKKSKLLNGTTIYNDDFRKFEEITPFHKINFEKPRYKGKKIINNLLTSRELNINKYTRNKRNEKEKILELEEKSIDLLDEIINNGKLNNNKFFVQINRKTFF